MIDKTELNIKIREAADTLLGDIQNMSEQELNENLRYFAERCKSIAERILEIFIKETKQRFSEGDFAIQDPALLGKFVDFTTGYQQQMLDWIKNNPLKVEESAFKFSERHDENVSGTQISPKTIAISGTVIAVGLYIFTNVWIALAAELITCLATLIQKKRIEKSQKQKLFEQQRYEQELIAKRDELVNGMIADLDKWLDKGEEASDKILKEYNI